MAGIVKTGQSVTAVFTTSLASTGAASNADSLPTGTLYVNGTANAATVTVTNITTGVYKAAVTLPSLSAGDIVDLRIAATVGGVAGSGVVWSAVGDTVRLSDTLTANPAAGGIAAASFASGAIDAAAIATDALGALELAAGAASEIATAVRTELGTELGRIDATVSSRASQTTLDTLDDYVDTEVAAIKAKTDNLPTDPADQSQVEAAITAAQGALAVLIGALNDIAAADVWAALDDASANKIADHTLRRTWANAAGSADGDALAFRSLLGAVAKLVNRVGIVGDTLTVYEADDTTAFGEQTLTSDADAEPITGVNTV